MRHIFLSLALLSSVASFADANAQERFPKWYVGLQGAVNFVDDSDLSNPPIFGGGSVDIDYDNGFGAGVALGYMPAGTQSFLDMMRFDLEYYYRKSDVDTFAGGSGSGDITSNSLMLNAYYDIATGTGWVPYLGAGAGLSEIELQTGTGSVDDSDTVFAWNLMAGVGYAPTSMPNTVWSIGYRYFAAEDPEFGITGTTSTTETDYDVHNVEAGVRLLF